jgi:hypothetical protein
MKLKLDVIRQKTKSTGTWLLLEDCDEKTKSRQDKEIIKWVNTFRKAKDFATFVCIDGVATLSCRNNFDLFKERVVNFLDYR